MFRASGLGRGFSSVSLASGILFTMGDLGSGQHVIALREEDGSLLWKTRIGPAWADPSLCPGSRSTPTADGDRIYALGTEGELACLRAATGEILWTRSLPRDFGGAMMRARRRRVEICRVPTRRVESVGCFFLERSPETAVAVVTLLSPRARPPPTTRASP